MTPPRAVVVGIAGTELDPEEAWLLERHQPLGVILFKRNVEAPAQLERLTADVRAALGRDDAPVLVDQEGGRVQRLGPPSWRAYPPAGHLGALADTDPEVGLEAARLVALAIARDLVAVGIDWVCAPVLDLALDETHAAIGDRAYSGDPARVTALGRAALDGFLAGRVVPIVKHAPGHGRARVDPHLELPRVAAPLRVLDDADFQPFRDLATAPAVMMAHVVYDAIDPERPASCSRKAVQLVRDRLGCTGFLVSDDVDMGALSGTVGERVLAVLGAGCDIALQCNGVRADLVAALDAAPPMSEAALERFTCARARLSGARHHDDPARLDALVGELAG